MSDTDQYHEPPEELPAKVRTFARMCAQIGEESEAISWYEQRIVVEKDPAAEDIMEDSQGEEVKHLCMNLAWLFRAKPEWSDMAQAIIFATGDIVKNAEAAEEALDKKEAAEGDTEDDD